MIYLIDTNILLRFVQRQHPLHSLVRAAVRALRQDGHTLRITPQNCVEFWNVATRPLDQNGFGFTPIEANHSLRLLERIFPMLSDTSAIYGEWRRLVVVHGVLGVQVHDARLVAAMKAHGVPHVLTFNTSDFARYAGESIVAVDPASII